jgi:hypothetical protein
MGTVANSQFGPCRPVFVQIFCLMPLKTVYTVRLPMPLPFIWYQNDNILFELTRISGLCILAVHEAFLALRP